MVFNDKANHEKEAHEGQVEGPHPKKGFGFPVMYPKTPWIGQFQAEAAVTL